MPFEDEVDHDLEWPWLERVQPDFGQEQSKDDADPVAVGAQEGQRPAEERGDPRRGTARLRHAYGPFLVNAEASRRGTSCGRLVALGMSTSTI